MSGSRECQQSAAAAQVRSSAWILRYMFWPASSFSPVSGAMMIAFGLASASQAHSTTHSAAASPPPAGMVRCACGRYNFLTWASRCQQVVGPPRAETRLLARAAGSAQQQLIRILITRNRSKLWQPGAPPHAPRASACVTLQDVCEGCCRGEPRDPSMQPARANPTAASRSNDLR